MAHHQDLSSRHNYSEGRTVACLLEVPGQYAGCGGGAGTRAALAGTAPDPERHARVLR